MVFILKSIPTIKSNGTYGGQMRSYKIILAEL